jgi:deoxyribonuclease I
MKRLTLLVLLSLLFATSSYARHSYYPQEFKTLVRDFNAVEKEELQDLMFQVLSEAHLQVNGQDDRLGCSNSGARGECVRHQSVGYKNARKVLFGDIHLERQGSQYFVKDYYCLVKYDSRAGVGPGKIPNNNVMNTEHIWPQSKFTNRFSKDMQKSDLHHLIPTNSRANSMRGNHPFDEVSNGDAVPDCDASQAGTGRTNSRGVHSFEPPDESKGNVARALLYFSVRYRMDLTAAELEVIERWNRLDPVDFAEQDRNEKIYEAQGNRNPFIDYPELVSVLAQ